MKKLVALLIILAAFLSLNSNTTFSQPQMKVHLIGGYNVPLGAFAGTYTYNYNYTTSDRPYFMSSGFNAGGDFKYFFGKKRNVGITFATTYNGFYSGDLDKYGAILDTGFTGVGNININVLAVGLGVEYSFMPKGKTQPFLGLEFNGNFFSGNVKTTPTSGTATTTDFESASRFGLGINFGVDFVLSKQVGAVIGTKYNWANLIGQETKVDTTVGGTTIQLGDGDYTIGGVTYDARSIGYLQLYAGVSFFFNQPKKK